MPNTFISVAPRNLNEQSGDLNLLSPKNSLIDPLKVSQSVTPHQTAAVLLQNRRKRMRNIGSNSNQDL